jgi:hypothetical protein
MLVGGNKIAMSRALGAAFLSHQVEQLERSTARGGRGDSNNNWRERDRDGADGRGAIPAPRNTAANDMRATPGGSPPKGGRKKGFDGRQVLGTGAGDARSKRRPAENNRKEADIIIVDASVLIHCISQIKAWCRDGREEVIIVPLEGAFYSRMLPQPRLLTSHPQRLTHSISSKKVPVYLLSEPEPPLASSSLRLAPTLASASRATPRLCSGMTFPSPTPMTPRSVNPPPNGSGVLSAAHAGRLPRLLANVWPSPY